MAWTYTLPQGQQFFNHVRTSPPRTRRRNDCRLLSPNSAVNGSSTFHKKALAGSGSSLFMQTNGLLIACGKQCVLSPRPFRFNPPANKADNEKTKRAEESEREERERSVDQLKVYSSLEKKERASSSLERKRTRVMSICRPATAPASTGQTEQRPETPSCRLVWRTREGEDGQIVDSPDSTSRGTPVLHLYLPSYQLTDTTQEATEEEQEMRSKMVLDTETDKQPDDVTDLSLHDFTNVKTQQDPVIQRHNEDGGNIQDDNKETNGESDSVQSANMEENVQDGDECLNNKEEDDLREEKGENDELVEDKRQREVPQSENKEHNECIEEVKQLDVTKKHEDEQQERGQDNGWDETGDDIKGLEKLLETQTRASEERELPVGGFSQKRSLEKREKTTPAMLKSGRSFLKTSHSLESNRFRRTSHPASVILFPSPFIHTRSFYGTSLDHLQTLPAKTWTPKFNADKRLVKKAKSEETPPKLHNAFKAHPESTTRPRLKIMSPDWGAPPPPPPPRKMKTTKTFVWGPWGPQETKSVCELAGVMRRRLEGTLSSRFQPNKHK